MAKKNPSPFTPEETNAIKAMLYNVNASNRCCNPAPFCWAQGYQFDEIDRIGREGLYADEQKEEENC